MTERRKNIKRRDDTYSCAGMGYTFDEAMNRQRGIIADRKADHVTVEIDVFIEPIGGGKYRVRDNSTYESKFG